jgi:pilus assembly protein CpaD
MTNNRTSLAVGLTAALLLGACSPATNYSSAEAPHNLTVDSSTTRVDVHFAPGSAHLTSAGAAALRRLAASGSISSADRVMVAAAGPHLLADQRIGAVSAVLLPYGIVVTGTQISDVPPNHGIVEVMRSLVTLPACPNWSKLSQPDYANQPSSNFGCATETNLGLMVANPTDLASARTLSAASGQPAAAAVQRYLTDKVTPLPVAAGATPFSAAASPTTATAPSNGSP